MKLITKPHKFRRKPKPGAEYSTQEWIDEAIKIIASLASDNFTPTLRQLFYRLVTLQILVNCKPDYRNFGRHVNEAKAAGMMDWDDVEDRTRWVRSRIRQDKGEQGRTAWAASALTDRHIDFWAGQPVRPEIWIEKDALIGIITPVCRKYDVNYYSLRGWGRPADNFSTAQRFLQDFYNNRAAGREKNRIFHLGDYDPTGCAVTPQIDAAIREFARQVRSDTTGGDFGSDDFVDIVRLGLTKEQIKTFKIVPNRIGDEKEAPNPIKPTAEEAKEAKKKEESRKAKFLADNDGCPDTWELDAIDPKQLESIVEDAIKSCITDKSAWNDRQRDEQSEIADIRKSLNLGDDAWYPQPLLMPDDDATPVSVP